jgi:DNA-binding GntR family transcriptional regulator
MDVSEPEGKSGGGRPGLSAHGKVPLNRQIARDLTDRIRSGGLGPGDPLPAEAELAQTYGVHRLTIRQAMNELVQQGLVTTARGKRAFVNPPPVRYRVDEAPGASLTSVLAEQGLSVRHEVCETARVGVADAPFTLDGARRCVRYSYRRWVDESPWSRSLTWLAGDLAPRAWTGERPILDVVAERHSLEIRRAIRTFAAVPASIEDADRLDVAVGTPLLQVTGTSIDQHGRTIAAVRHHVRGDRAEYLVHLAH